MEQTKIDRYVDNLDAKTRAELLKRTLKLCFDTSIPLGDINFIEEQIREFNEKYSFAISEWQ